MQENFRVIALLGQKGGSGKTTLAVHIAVAAQEAGEIVGIADTDPQGTAYRWVERREAKDPPAALIESREIDSAIATAKKSGVTLLVVDTPPHASLGAYQAVANADLIIMPCRPTMFDIETIERATAIAEASKRKGFFVLNQCPAQGNETESASEVLSTYGFPVAPVMIGLRKAYSRATITGQAVTEFDPTGKAAEEIRGLWEWTKEKLKS